MTYVIRNKKKRTSRSSFSHTFFAVLGFLVLNVFAFATVQGIVLANAAFQLPHTHVVSVHYSLVHDDPISIFRINDGGTFGFIPTSPPESVAVDGVQLKFIFGGWFTDPKAEDEQTRVDESTLIKSDLKLFARWYYYTEPPVDSFT